MFIAIKAMSYSEYWHDTATISFIFIWRKIGAFHLF
jgi:hypothetical protein